MTATNTLIHLNDQTRQKQPNCRSDTVLLYSVGLVLVLLLTLTQRVWAQETGYVSDSLLVPVRSGAGNEYRIVHRGIPSGTTLTVFERSEDGEWAEIETRGGTRGWIPIQYLLTEPPAALLLADRELQLTQMRNEREKLRSTLANSESAASEAGGEISQLQAELDTTKTALAELTRVSGAAIELDTQNRQLTTDLESQRSQAELLRLENVRLQERIDNAQLLDGAFAVLLGVVIAVVSPRLWPRRRRNDGWT